MTSFPKARITRITTAREQEEQAAADALPEAEDSDDDAWDPFEET